MSVSVRVLSTYELSAQLKEYVGSREDREETVVHGWIRDDLLL